MSLTDPNLLRVGDVIRFKTVNPHDNIYHTGKIRAVCDYDTAKLFDDVDTYYQEVLRYVPTLGDKQILTYLALYISENQTSGSTKVFAIEVIDKVTLELVEENTYTDFRVYDIDESKAKDVLDAIRTLGYTCNIITE